MQEKKDDFQKALEKKYGFVFNLFEELVASQCKSNVLTHFQSLAGLAKQYREAGKPDAIQALQQRIQSLDIKKKAELIKVFHLYFQLNNLIEDAIRIDLNQQRALEQADPRKNTLRALVLEAKQNRLSLKAFLALLQESQIALVWTAHPTETQPLSKLYHIQKLGKLIQTVPDTGDHIACFEHKQAMQATLSLLWQTADNTDERMHVLDELRRQLYIMESSVLKVMPKILADLTYFIADIYQVNREKIKLKPLVHFKFWPGGDRDGNPNVTATVSMQALCLQQRSFYRLCLQTVKTLLKEISISSQQGGASEALKKSINQDKKQYPAFAAQTAALNKHEPYRKKLDFIRMKLECALIDLGIFAKSLGMQKTLVGRSDQDLLTQQARPYPLKMLLAEIMLIQNSLQKYHASAVAFSSLERWRVQIEIFQQMALEVRQHAAVHRQALEESFACMGIKTETDLALQAAIVQEVRSVRILGVQTFWDQLSPASQELYQSLRMIMQAQQQFSKHCIQTYIISMTHHSSDVLAVLLLFKEVGLVKIKKGKVSAATMDIVPLFESKEALQSAPAVMDQLFSDPFYRSYLLKRNNIQEIMLGYSDSNKDCGPLASHLLIQSLQEKLLKLAKKYGLNIRFFHGRGGTISRGGGPMGRAIQALPTESTHCFKMTEQGETVSANYLNPDLAYRHLEQIIYASLNSQMKNKKTTPKSKEAFKFPKSYLKELIQNSQNSYEALVKKNADFAAFFHSVTPIDVLTFSTIGSRPSKRPESIDALQLTEAYRAIPWVFAWMQTRLLISGFYGVGTAFHQFEQRYGIEALQELYIKWPFFKTFIQNIQMVLLKADLKIAQQYMHLHPKKKLAQAIFDCIESEYTETVEQVLQIAQQDSLMADSPKIKAQILRRNPFVDPINILQIDGIQQWRLLKNTSPAKKLALQKQLLETVNAIAAGVRNYG